MYERLFELFPDDFFGGEPLTQEKRDREFLSSRAFAGMTKEKFEKLFPSPNLIASDAEYFRRKVTRSSFDVDEADISEDHQADRDSLVASIKLTILQIFTDFYNKSQNMRTFVDETKSPPEVKELSPDFTWQGLWDNVKGILPHSRDIDDNQKKRIFLNVADEMERDYLALSKTEETASE